VGPFVNTTYSPLQILIDGSAYWCEHPELFAAIADAPTEEDRALAVLKWFIVSIIPLYAADMRLTSPIDGALS